MAFPKDLTRIDTNLSPSELDEVVRAIEEHRVNWVPSCCSVFAESGGGSFTYRGARYELSEILETVTSLHIQNKQQEPVLSQ